MHVCLVLPVHNEELVLKKNLGQIVEALKGYPAVQWEVVIADNGSTDSTRQIAKKFIQQQRGCLITLRSTPTAGRGNALRDAWEQSEADWYFYMDIDLAVDLNDLATMVPLLHNTNIDGIIGSRYLEKASVHRQWHRTVLSVVYNTMTRWILQLHLTDTQCGWKAFRRNVIVETLPFVQNTHWFFDTELLVLATRQNKTIVEMPVHWVDKRDDRRKSKVNIMMDVLLFLIKMMGLRLRLFLG